MFLKLKILICYFRLLDAWKMFYEFRDEFELMPYSFFGNKLRSLRFGMKKKEGIDWGASAAREIIINDLEQNILSNDEDEFPAGKCCCFCDHCQQYIFCLKYLICIYYYRLVLIVNSEAWDEAGGLPLNLKLRINKKRCNFFDPTICSCPVRLIKITQQH